MYHDAINPAASVLAREVIAKGFFDPLRSKPSCFKSLACHVPHWVIIVELQISSLNASVGNPADGNESAEPGESAYIIRPFHDRLVQRHSWHYLSAHQAKNHHNSAYLFHPPAKRRRHFLSTILVLQLSAQPIPFVILTTCQPDQTRRQWSRSCAESCSIRRVTFANNGGVYGRAKIFIFNVKTSVTSTKRPSGGRNDFRFFAIFFAFHGNRRIISSSLFQSYSATRASNGGAIHGYR